MASPLRWFRKHQQIMMVFFGVGLMAIFGLGSVFTMLDPNRLTASRDNPLIATWKYGKITRDDLARIQKNHFAAGRFLDEVLQVAQSQSEKPIQPMAPMIRSIQTGQDFDQDRVDQEILRKMVLQKYAEKEGIVISDGMIEDYITLLTGRSELNRDDLQAANKRVNQTSNLDVVYEQLKMELAVMKVEELATTIPVLPLYQGFPATINPTEAVELYERTARQVECRVMPIDVDPESVTAKPSDSELKELFEEGKTKLAGGDGLEPGFRVPPKINVGYFVADAESYIQNEIAKLTDKQVQEEYDRLVKEGDGLVMERIIEEENNVEPPGGGEADPTNNTNAEQSGEANAGGEEANSDDGQDSGESQSSGDSGEANSDDNLQSRSVTQSKSSFVNLQEQEQKEETKEDKKKSEEAAKDQKTEETKQEQDTKQAEPKKETDNSDSKQAEQKEASDDKPANQDPAKSGAGDQEQQEKSAEEKNTEGSNQELPGMADDPEPEFNVLPLKEVADKIKRRLAIPEADKKMKANLLLAEREIGSYKYDYQRFQSAQDGEDIEDPGSFDGKQWATKYNLKYDETSLLNMAEMEKSTVGTISVPVTMNFGGRPISIQLPLFRTLFDQFNKLTLFTPKSASDVAGSQYLYWIAETQDTYVPEFEEVREQVVAFWKKKNAYQNALENAEKIVEELKSSNSDLAAKFPEKSKATGQFSWFNTLGQLQINNVEELPMADNDLMKMIFSLEKGEFGFGPNGPHDKVFVVEMLNTGDTRAELADEYLNEQFFKLRSIPADVTAASEFYAGEYVSKWMTEIYDDLDFKPAE